MDILDLTQSFIGQAVIFKNNRIVLDARADRAGHRLRLLHDLLEHEVLIAAFFRCGQIPVNRLHRLINYITEFVHDRDAVRPDDCNLVIIQNDILLGAANDRRYVRRDHVFALAHTDNQRAGTARRDDLLRIIHGDHTQRIRTAHTLHRIQHGLRQVLLLAGVQIVHQMRDRLGIGFGLEGIAVRLQAFAQLLVVLNDTVMHYRDLALAVTPAEMRMRVTVGRFAMRRPARMADAAGAVQPALFFDLFLQIGDPSLRFDNAQPVLCKRRNTSGVIAAVFQTVQTFQQNRKRVFASGKTNDSTHINQFLQE